GRIGANRCFLVVETQNGSPAGWVWLPFQRSVRVPVISRSSASGLAGFRAGLIFRDSPIEHDSFWLCHNGARNLPAPAPAVLRSGDVAVNRSRLTWRAAVTEEYLTIDFVSRRGIIVCIRVAA